GGVADVPGLRGELDELVPRRTGTLSVKGNLERSTGAAKDVAVTDLGAAIGLDIARQQIPETFIPVRSFVAAGFHTPGDMGRGAIYARGTSAGPLAIQDKGGTWFNLVVGDVIVAGHLGCRPVFLRSGCSIAAGSRQMLVNSGTQWRVGDRVLVQGAGANPKAFSKTFQVNGPPARSGPIFFGADGYLFNANSGDGGVTFLTTDTAEQCAASIRAGSWAGWTVTGTGRQATFTCNQARGSIGVRFSDIYGNALPITETLNQEGAGDFIARVVSIVGDTLTLDRDAVTAITGSLCYLEHGSQIREFMDAVPGKTLQLQAGAYLFFRGLKHTKEGTGAIGAGLQNTIIYAVTAAEDLTEWELPTAEVGFFAPKFQDLTIDMMEARRHGATFRRLWDGASVRNVAIINVAAEYSGWRVMRHSTQAPSQSVNDQAVISQSLNADNIHVERASNSSGLYPVPVTYMEYVQEGSLTNFKSIVRGDSNTSQNTVACQWEACRGLVAGAGTSFALAGTGLKVTSITGQSEGCSVAGATFETNGKSVDFAGGTYDIRTFDIVAPRYIGAGGDIVANRLSSGLIMARDRFLRLTAGARNVRYLSDDPSKVIDEVAANNNVDLSSYHYGRTKELPVDLTLRKALATLLLRTPGGNAFYRLQMSATDSVNYGLFFQSSQDGVSWTTAMSLNPDGSLSLNIPFVGFRQLVSGPPDSGGSGSRALIVNN
ncbi:hypothetical protein, partial [Methylobacterium sp.]|uniref:hypothetical protein n=1 Tax=Methylobacterium sp. TaxID=409 RepID=UPI0025E250DE